MSETLLQQHATSFQRLCNGINREHRRADGILRGNVTVVLRQISFLDEEHAFMEKLDNSDVFYMAGFTTKVDHVEQIYRHRRFDGKRFAVANKCVTNQLSCWGVCGSAVSFGNRWTLDSTGRTMGYDCRIFELLGTQGFVTYSNDEISHGIDDWRFMSGTGMCICIGSEVTCADAFRVVNAKKSTWNERAE